MSWRNSEINYGLKEEAIKTAGSATGYLHARYAESLSEFGTPRLLPASGGWIIEREIPNSTLHDAMGCYPLFVCRDWSQLNSDFAQMRESLVCLSLISDPLEENDVAYLRSCFPDVCIPFKRHFVVDLSQSEEDLISLHHRRNVRKALRRLVVEKCAKPTEFLNDWTALYGTLIERHNLRGIPAFSRSSFAQQLSVPGLVAFRAIDNETTVGMVLWYTQGTKAYYHLGAYSIRGYELLASFALFSHSISYFAQQGFERLNLGAEAGAKPDGKSGLSRFKRGWASGERTAYFCGRIFDRVKYQELVSDRNLTTSYFPAYRHGEFG